MSEPRAWLESNVTLVSRVVGGTARRSRLRPEDRDELLSLVWSHLTRDDYRALRQFRGSSAIATYIRVVVDRVLLDLRTARWGRWRPSAEARRLGEPAVAFERLVVRDGYPPSEAREVLRTRGASLSAELETRLARRLPRGRHFVDLSLASATPAPGDPFTALLHRQQARRGARLAVRLERALSDLPAADQVLVRMRYEQGLKVSQIATMLGANQKKLYRRLDAIHAGLKAALTGLGVCPREAVELTTEDVSHLPAVLRRTVGHAMPNEPDSPVIATRPA